MKLLKFVGLFSLVLIVLCVSLYAITYTLLPKIEVSTSILVLGKGGEGHTAPNLTDTMMVAYLNKDSNKVSVLSLPRDIWVPEIRAKLNTAYHYGGFEMAKNSAASITGQQVDYIVVIDFSLFKDLIDSIEGVNVRVDNSFADEKYPIAGKENDSCNGDKLYGCRYERIEFKGGNQTMDGETALKFVRSRNAEGVEGTDLAREKRQQQVIEGVKQKLLSSEVINMPTIKKIYNVFSTYTETDIDTKVAIQIARFAFESKDNINFLSIPEGMLKVSQNDRKYDRQYVFLPASGIWKDFQEWIKNKI